MLSTHTEQEKSQRYVDIYNSGGFYLHLKNMEYSDYEICLTGTLLYDGTIEYRHLFVGDEHTVTIGDIKAIVSVHNHFSGSERLHMDIINRKVSEDVSKFFHNKDMIFLNPSPHDMLVWYNIYNKDSPQIFGITAESKYGYVLKMFDFNLLNEEDIQSIRKIGKKYSELIELADETDDGEIYSILYRFHNEPSFIKVLDIAYDLIDL